MPTPTDHSTRPPPSPRRVLVTGGAGFIGSHLVEALLARGDLVTVVDNLSTGRRENLPASDRLCFLHANLSDGLGTLAGEPGFHEIYHLAAAVGVKLVLDDPIAAIETNVGETGTLLRFAAGQAGLTPRVLIASSSEVYGKGSKEVFAEDDDVVYGPTTVTRWSYACAKALDEHLALAYHARGLWVTIARFFNTVGPRQVGEYGMVLPRFIGAAIEGRPLTVFGTGEQSRCFCDVRDVASALPKMIAGDGCAGRVFNLGSDRPITIRQLAELVVRELGSSSRMEHVAYDRAYAAGFEDLRQRRPSLERVRRAIGFEAQISLERTIRDIAQSLGWKSPESSSGAEIAVKVGNNPGGLPGGAARGSLA